MYARARDHKAGQSPRHTPEGAGKGSISVDFFHARRPEKDATGGGATKTFPAVQIPVSISWKARGRVTGEPGGRGEPGGSGQKPGNSSAKGLRNRHNGLIKAAMAGRPQRQEGGVPVCSTPWTKGLSESSEEAQHRRHLPHTHSLKRVALVAGLR